MIEIVNASPAHVGMLARRLRPIDVLECALAGRTPKQALRLSLTSACYAWTAKAAGRPVAMFGVSTLSALDGLGSPWLLLTDEAMEHRKALVTLGRSFTARFLRDFRRLENRVHRDNDAAIAWLQHLGYTVEPAAVGAPLREFYRERD